MTARVRARHGAMEKFSKKSSGGVWYEMPRCLRVKFKTLIWERLEIRRHYIVTFRALSGGTPLYTRIELVYYVVAPLYMYKVGIVIDVAE